MERVEQVTSTDSQCVHRDGSTLGKLFWREPAGLNCRHCRQGKEAELKPFLTPSCLRNYQQEGEKSFFLLNLCLSASHSLQDTLRFQTPYLLFLSRLPPLFLFLFLSFSLSLGSQEHAAGLRSLLMEGWCNTSQACGTQACKQHLSSVQCSPTSIQPILSSPLPSAPAWTLGEVPPHHLTVLFITR